MANFYSFHNIDNPLMDMYRHTDDVTGTTKGDFITQVSDNNYNTSSSVSRIKINIDKKGDGTGTGQHFSHIFLKCKGVASYKLFLADSATAVYTETISDETFTRTGSYQHNLRDVFGSVLETQVAQQSITLEFTKIENMMNIEIYQIFVLDHQLELDSEGFTDIQPVNKDRTGGIHTAIEGSETRYESLGTRDKIEIQYEKPLIVGARELKKSDGTYMSPDEFGNRFQYFTHTHKRFVFERDYKQTFEATAGDWLTLTDYRMFRAMHKQTGALISPTQTSGYTLQDIIQHFITTEVKFDGEFYKVDLSDIDNTPDIGSSPPGAGWIEIASGEETYPDDRLIFPDLVYIALFKNLELPTPFWSDVKTNGISLEFQVCES